MLLWLGSLPKSGNLTACHVHFEAQLEVVEMSYDKVDWSVAPADATHWEMTEVGKAVWSQEQLFENEKGSLVRGRFVCEGDRDLPLISDFLETTEIASRLAQDGTRPRDTNMISSRNFCME
ncbi:hypothetical protein B0B27_10795 [Pseudomonas aeruginosa]|nr:hypothetical protein B0B27_10795 [Pseudomonas aeruginosa]